MELNILPAAGRLAAVVTRARACAGLSVSCPGCGAVVTVTLARETRDQRDREVDEYGCRRPSSACPRPARAIAERGPGRSNDQERHVSSSSSPAHTDVITKRLILRPWTTNEATAVLDDARPTHWAGDFPAEGDRVVAGLFGQHPAWLDAYGHRLIIERESGLVVGSIGLFWPPSEGVLEIGYGIVASAAAGAMPLRPPRPWQSSPSLHLRSTPCPPMWNCPTRPRSACWRRPASIGGPPKRTRRTWPGSGSRVRTAHGDDPRGRGGDASTAHRGGGATRQPA